MVEKTLEKELNFMVRKYFIVIMSAICACLILVSAAQAAENEPPALYVFETRIPQPNGQEALKRYGYMDKKGNVVIAPQFECAEDFSEGLAAVHRPEIDYVGYIDTNGKYVIPDDTFRYGYKFDGGTALVDSMNAASSYDLARIDRKGKIIFDRYMGSFNDGYAVYDIKTIEYDGGPLYEIPDGLVMDSYFNEKLEPATKLKFGNAEDFSDGLAAVSQWKNEKRMWGVINTKFELVVDYDKNHKYDWIYPYKYGLMPVKKDNKIGFIDKNGKMIIGIQYDVIRNGSGAYESVFYEGLACVSKNGKFGYINNKGEAVIPLQYENARRFSEGLAAVKQNGKWGFIDKKGEMVIEPQYKYVENCKNGLILIGKRDDSSRYAFYDKFEGYINKKGQKIEIKGTGIICEPIKRKSK